MAWGANDMIVSKDILPPSKKYKYLFGPQKGV